MTQSDPLPEYDLLAGEFVLGLLEGDDLLRVRGLLARDPDFAERVLQWEERLAPLVADAPAREPPAAIWPRIEAAIAPSRDPEDGAGAELVTLRRRLARWRLTAGFSAALAASLALLLVAGPLWRQASDAPPPRESPLLAASIPIADTPLRLALTYVPERDQLSVSAAGLASDGVHDHELWVVDGEGGLHSLGVVAPGEEARFAVDPALAPALHEGARLVLTREPLGGHSEGEEAGPVVAEGHFTAI